MKIQTVSKTGEAVVAAPKYKGNASLVQLTGLGIKKSFAGRMSQFNVDATKAGE